MITIMITVAITITIMKSISKNGYDRLFCGQNSRNRGYFRAKIWVIVILALRVISSNHNVEQRVRGCARELIDMHGSEARRLASPG